MLPLDKIQESAACDHRLPHWRVLIRGNSKGKLGTALPKAITLGYTASVWRNRYRGE